MLKNDLILAIKSPPGWGIRKIFSPGGGNFSGKILPHPRGFRPSPGGGWVSKRIEASIKNYKQLKGLHAALSFALFNFYIRIDRAWYCSILASFRGVRCGDSGGWSAGQNGPCRNFPSKIRNPPNGLCRFH